MEGVWGDCGSGGRAGLDLVVRLAMVLEFVAVSHSELSAFTAGWPV